MSDATPEYIAAAATVVSAGVIAWQAFETRKSVKAAQKAVSIAQETLSQSQISLIEQTAPRLFVKSDGPLDPNVMISDVAPGLVKLADDRVLRLPKEATLTIRVLCEVEIRNEGTATVSIQFSSEFLITRYDSDENELWTEHARSAVIDAGKSTEGKFVVERTVAEWAAIDDQRASGDPGEPYRFEVTYIGPRDADIIEKTVVTLGGSLLEPVPDELGAWKLRGGGGWELRSVVQPSTRIYYKSRTNDELFFPPTP